MRLVISSGPDTRNVTVPTLTGTHAGERPKHRHQRGAENLQCDGGKQRQAGGPGGLPEHCPQHRGGGGAPGIVLQVSKGPEKQEPVTSTKNIEITLPDDERESVEVRITVDGKEVYKNDVSTEQGSFYVPVTGSGVMEICIYFDGSLEKRYSENFNE